MKLSAAERPDDKTLELFEAFVQVLFDVDEPGEDWRNRLGWAWDLLADFADHLGPDFASVANIDGRLDYRRERQQGGEQI